VSTKVLLAHDGDDLGTQVLDPLRECVKVADCCDPFFTGTLPYIKMIKKYVLRAPLPSYACDTQ
jgi:hypothetical protein